MTLNGFSVAQLIIMTRQCVVEHIESVQGHQWIMQRPACAISTPASAPDVSKCQIQTQIEDCCAPHNSNQQQRAHTLDNACSPTMELAIDHRASASGHLHLRIEGSEQCRCSSICTTKRTVSCRLCTINMHATVSRCGYGKHLLEESSMRPRLRLYQHTLIQTVTPRVSIACHSEQATAIASGMARSRLVLSLQGLAVTAAEESAPKAEASMSVMSVLRTVETSCSNRLRLVLASLPGGGTLRAACGDTAALTLFTVSANFFSWIMTCSAQRGMLSFERLGSM